jgi:hypothetical protein
MRQFQLDLHLLTGWYDEIELFAQNKDTILGAMLSIPIGRAFYTMQIKENLHFEFVHLSHLNSDSET